MAAITAAGTITFGTTKIAVGIREVVVNQMVDIAETSNFSNADTWKTFIAELKEWDGSFNINWDSAHTHTIGETGALSAVMTSGPTFKGSVIITNIGTPVPFGRLLVCPVTFKGTGALAFA